MDVPAAFGRLCVETVHQIVICRLKSPAAFGRLCVETVVRRDFIQPVHPAAFGRLCVETLDDVATLIKAKPSRLRAAVC